MVFPQRRLMKMLKIVQRGSVVEVHLYNQLYKHVFYVNALSANLNRQKCPAEPGIKPVDVEASVKVTLF